MNSRIACTETPVQCILFDAGRLACHSAKGKEMQGEITFEMLNVPKSGKGSFIFLCSYNINVSVTHPKKLKSFVLHP